MRTARPFPFRCSGSDSMKAATAERSASGSAAEAWGPVGDSSSTSSHTISSLTAAIEGGSEKSASTWRAMPLSFLGSDDSMVLRGG